MNRTPQPGDVYVVCKPFETLGTFNAGLDGYEPGDTLTIFEPTGCNPFDQKEVHTHWVVKCKHFKPPQEESVWAWIPGFIREGFIKLVSK